MAIQDQYYLTHQEINSLRADAKQASKFCRALLIRDHYLKTYHYFVEWSEKKHRFIGQCSEFPTVLYLDHDIKIALSGIKKRIEDVTKDMIINAKPIPIPLGNPPINNQS
ncbi:MULTISPECIES: hypothetical protein [Acinetobacter]|uniref:hypothetical protein n=1 Tax=Acinetobacter TaxID=469 RepID=UPI000235D83E|nr:MULTISPECIES: hypothetical protein [Acinetobacter]KXZ75385.1 hypothetical protein AVENLUH8758_00127 [Acinetobacter venetianus]GAB01495.1 hypothetical protein ACT4_021_01110 [Acinetobacter sp. NBRC 100985]